MILQRLLAFLDQHPVASAGEIARGIGASPDATRSMLATLQRRGLIETCGPLPTCGGCEICAPTADPRYRCVKRSRPGSDRGDASHGSRPF
jgi:hypothetical protein